MAAGDRYYYLAALPTPGDLGSPPPLTPAQLLEQLAEAGHLRLLVETLLLQDDLLQREAFLAGEITEVNPVVLTPAQARNEALMPDNLITPGSEGGEALNPVGRVDQLLEVYFRHAAALARRLGSPFLTAWVSHEVGLRNALASLRASRLGLDPADYRVAGELADPDEDDSAVTSEWNAAADPLEGQRILLRARWAWILERQGWFSFSNDELAVYAAQVMLLGQWRRLITSDEPATATAAADRA